MATLAATSELDAVNQMLLSIGQAPVNTLTVTGIKDVTKLRVGDTLTDAKRPAAEALPGFKEVQPVVFCGLFPVDAADFEALRAAVEKVERFLDRLAGGRVERVVDRHALLRPKRSVGINHGLTAAVGLSINGMEWGLEFDAAIGFDVFDGSVGNLDRQRVADHHRVGLGETLEQLRAARAAKNEALEPGEIRLLHQHARLRHVEHGHHHLFLAPTLVNPIIFF